MTLDSLAKLLQSVAHCFAAESLYVSEHWACYLLLLKAKRVHAGDQIKLFHPHAVGTGALPSSYSGLEALPSSCRGHWSPSILMQWALERSTVQHHRCCSNANGPLSSRCLLVKRLRLKQTNSSSNSLSSVVHNIQSMSLFLATCELSSQSWVKKRYDQFILLLTSTSFCIS